MTARDDHDPRLTEAMALWAETAVPALPDDFTARVMADVAAAQAVTAWADEAVPELSDDFTARVMADVAVGRAVGAWEESVPELPDDFAATVAARAARPKLQVVDGGGGKPATKTVEAAPRSGRGWLWPVVAVAAAGLLALWTSRTPAPGEHHDVVAQHINADVPTVTPVVEPVLVAMAEVTRVDVVGVQSVAVMSVAGEGGGVASPVVWITDKDEDDGTRMQ